jgi:hypothetical protein
LVLAITKENPKTAKPTITKIDASASRSSKIELNLLWDFVSKQKSYGYDI